MVGIHDRENIYVSSVTDGTRENVRRVAVIRRRRPAFGMAMAAYVLCRRINVAIILRVHISTAYNTYVSRDTITSLPSGVRAVSGVRALYINTSISVAKRIFVFVVAVAARNVM